METQINNEIRLTWEEMKKQYPDQWLYVADPESGIPPHIKSGVVLLADADKKQLYERIHQLRPEKRWTQVIYTGIILNENHAWRLVSFSKDLHKKH